MQRPRLGLFLWGALTDTAGRRAGTGRRTEGLGSRGGMAGRKELPRGRPPECRWATSLDRRRTPQACSHLPRVGRTEPRQPLTAPPQSATLLIRHFPIPQSSAALHLFSGPGIETSNSVGDLDSGGQPEGENPRSSGFKSTF